MAANPPVRSGAKTIMVYPEQLVENPGNHRFELGDIKGLAQSILAHGIKQALKVKKLKEKTDDGYPKYLVLVGNRRTKAAKSIADKMEVGDFVPVEVVPEDYTAEQAVLDSMITDVHSKERNMFEIGLDIQVLVEAGRKQKDIAKEIGKSAVYVGDCLFLVTNATDAIVKDIKAGVVTPYQAIEMLRSEDSPEKVEEVITKAKNIKAKKDEEESIVNPDKKANTKTTLKKSELTEASGKPIKVGKSTSAAETSKQQAGGPTEQKVDATMTKLLQLRDTMKANKTTGVPNASAFNALNGAIKYCKGTMTAMDLLEYFFDDAGEEEAEEAKPKAKAKKEKEAPAAKPTKGAQPIAKKGKKAAAEEEPADDELEDLDDLLESDELDDDLE